MHAIGLLGGWQLEATEAGMGQSVRQIMRNCLVHFTLAIHGIFSLLRGADPESVLMMYS